MTGAGATEGQVGRPRGWTIGLWIVAAALFALYVLAGTPKVLGASRAVLNFRLWGYPDSFRILIGVLEIAGGLGLLVPRLTTWAAGGLVCIMLGAIYTHLSTATPGVFVPVIALMALAALAYTRRKDALFLAESSSTAPGGTTSPPAS